MVEIRGWGIGVGVGGKAGGCIQSAVWHDKQRPISNRVTSTENEHDDHNHHVEIHRSMQMPDTYLENYPHYLQPVLYMTFTFFS